MTTIYIKNKIILLDSQRMRLSEAYRYFVINVWHLETFTQYNFWVSKTTTLTGVSIYSSDRKLVVVYKILVLLYIIFWRNFTLNFTLKLYKKILNKTPYIFILNKNNINILLVLFYFHISKKVLTTETDVLNVSLIQTCQFFKILNYECCLSMMFPSPRTNAEF